MPSQPVRLHQGDTQKQTQTQTDARKDETTPYDFSIARLRKGNENRTHTPGEEESALAFFRSVGGEAIAGEGLLAG